MEFPRHAFHVSDVVFYHVSTRATGVVRVDSAPPKLPPPKTTPCDVESLRTTSIGRSRRSCRLRRVSARSRDRCKALLKKRLKYGLRDRRGVLCQWGCRAVWGAGAWRERLFRRGHGSGPYSKVSVSSMYQNRSGHIFVLGSSRKGSPIVPHT